MRYLLLTFGTRGDVEPFLALGQRLHRSGHDVLVAAPSAFGPLAGHTGLQFHPVGDALFSLIVHPRIRRIIESRRGGLLGWLRTALEMTPAALPALRTMLSEQQAAAQLCDAIVFHPKAIAGSDLAAARRVPAFVVTPFPAYVPTAEFPLFIFPELPLGGRYNRSTYSAARFGTLLTKRVIDAWRQSLGLPRRRWRSDIEADDGAALAVLHCFSESIVPRPRDWPTNALVTGYWFREQPNWTPPRTLERFVNAGPPPVVVCFGGMVGSNPVGTTRLLRDALSRTGHRAVLVTAQGGICSEDLPPAILAIESVPFDWILPRAAALVHHGGAGSVGMALRHGCPSVVCPFFADQPFWGRRLYRLGAAPEPIPFQALDGDRLASALEQATTSSPIRRRADELALELTHDAGLDAAITALCL